MQGKYNMTRILLLDCDLAASHINKIFEVNQRGALLPPPPPVQCWVTSKSNRSLTGGSTSPARSRYVHWVGSASPARWYWAGAGCCDTAYNGCGYDNERGKGKFHNWLLIHVQVWLVDSLVSLLRTTLQMARCHWNSHSFYWMLPFKLKKKPVSMKKAIMKWWRLTML